MISKKCSRQACEEKIELYGWSCSRVRQSFWGTKQLCAECADVYCQVCYGSKCQACNETGRLSDRQVAQRVAGKRHSAHWDECKVCSAEPAEIACEDYTYSLDGKEIGKGKRLILAQCVLCETGKQIERDLIELGADMSNGCLEGFDGVGWNRRPILRLMDGYTEAVTARRELSEEPE